ncbi:MAG: hypothetical protein U1F41_08715 [Burkholderiales bacterium]
MPAFAGAQTAVLGNFQQIYVYPQISFPPGACPATVPVNTVAGGAGPSHGVGFYGTDFALVSYFGQSQIRNVQLSTATVLNTINTSGVGYSGTGTIAVAPSLSYAIAATGNTAFIFQGPFTAPTATTVTLPGSVAGYQTEAIVFNAASRAFIAHSGGISVLDPPYTSVAFTIPGDFESVALTPDGNTLLATNLNAQLGIINGPFSAASTTAFLTIGGAALDGITVTPDGTRALVISASGTSPLYSIAAPFTTTSTVDVIPFPAGLGSFEDISVSSDGLYALATGNNGTNMGLVRAPFTTAAATSCQIPITGGRGAGAVRFLPPGLQPPPPPPPQSAQIPVPAGTPAGLALMAILMAALGAFGLRRLRR